MSDVFHLAYKASHNGNWPRKGEEFLDWHEQLAMYSAIEDWDRAKLGVVVHILKELDLKDYAEEVYWTALALRMKQVDEEKSDER